MAKKCNNDWRPDKKNRLHIKKNRAHVGGGSGSGMGGNEQRGDPDKNADYQKEFAHSPALIRRKEDWRILGSRYIIFLLPPSRGRIPRPLILFPLKKTLPRNCRGKMRETKCFSLFLGRGPFPEIPTSGGCCSTCSQSSIDSSRRAAAAGKKDRGRNFYSFPPQVYREGRSSFGKAVRGRGEGGSFASSDCSACLLRTLSLFSALVQVKGQCRRLQEEQQGKEGRGRPSSRPVQARPEAQLDSNGSKHTHGRRGRL